MKEKNNKRTLVLSLILVGLLIVTYKMLFMNDSVTTVGMPIGINSNSAINSQSLNQDIIKTGSVDMLLSEMEKINFDISILEDSKFKSLKSIDLPIVSLPIGRENPFAEIYSPNSSVLQKTTQ